MEWIKSMLEILKLDRKSTFVVAMVCSALLVFKGIIKKHFNARYFYNHFEMLVLIAALVMWAILLADFLGFCKKKIQNNFNLRKGQKFLSNLEGRKLEIVANMYFTTNHSDELQNGDSDVLMLKAHGVLLKTGQLTTMYTDDEISNPYFTHILQPWVVEYFDKHKEKVKQYEDD